MATITKIKCDLCGNEASHPKTKVQTNFLTEQTEGRAVTPHLSIETIDLCDPCLRRIVDGMPLIGSGAQGHNTFKWR